MQKSGSNRLQSSTGFTSIPISSHYYPFGVPDSYQDSNRSWSDASRVYRYGFNGKEIDFETANDNFPIAIWIGARIYDGSLGTWLSVDPVCDISKSKYVSFKNSPVLFIDKHGETDFYNLYGEWIGTDGVSNSQIVVVTENKLVNRIIKYSVKGLEYTAELLNGYEDKVENIVYSFDANPSPMTEEAGNDVGEFRGFELNIIIGFDKRTTKYWIYDRHSGLQKEVSDERTLVVNFYNRESTLQFSIEYKSITNILNEDQGGTKKKYYEAKYPLKKYDAGSEVYINNQN
ncbi:MAG: hypothetical protein JNM67_06470 [Bacteroidetes bacterium]|nr:hypothetical protein [Bacteroidota bacterium]